MFQTYYLEITLASAVFFPIFITALFEDEVCTNENCSNSDGAIPGTTGTGDSASVDADMSCDPTMCRGEGRCVIENGEPTCKCLEQYFIGPYCNVETDNCKFTGVFEQCDPMGTEQCVAYFGGRYCKCRKSYYGTNCNKNKNFKEYLRPAPSPMVYFLHENVEGGDYKVYITVENISDTQNIICTISGRQVRRIQSLELKRNYKLSKFMGLTNIPEKINQNYYYTLVYTFNEPGLFMIRLTFENVKFGFAWETSYYFPGRTIKNTLEYGECPPKIFLHGLSGVCFPNKLSDNWLPTITENVKYVIHYELTPCKDEEEKIKLSYFVTDLYDVRKIYQVITKAFMVPPVRLNLTASLVIRAEGEYGTSYAQCYVRFMARRPMQKVEHPIYEQGVRDQMLRDEDYDPDDPDYEKDDDDVDATDKSSDTSGSKNEAEE